MTKVITYGTYDLLHHGHIRLLERAKALGDYLVVGVTSDDFDKARGKINIQQSLMERVEAVRGLGIADEIIVEEYEGQKIDDIKRYEIDIFTVGSDWEGKFDYLKKYCKVIYLPRTEGVSSSEVRADKRRIRIGFVGDYETNVLKKYYNECMLVNGIEVSGIFARSEGIKDVLGKPELHIFSNYKQLLEESDAIYLLSHPTNHGEQIKEAIENNKHVLCESPIALNEKENKYLRDLAYHNHVVLMDSIKTAFSTAYYRLLLLIKSGQIGDVVSIDATCTSVHDPKDMDNAWNSICAWGPTALLPVFQIIGTDYLRVDIVSRIETKDYDTFTRIVFEFPHSVASVKVGRGIKSEGELIISGTKGYIYVPAPWWKTDYFEVRYENIEENRRYFYRLEGEGIRYELVDFVRSIKSGKNNTYIDVDVSDAICRIMNMFYTRENMRII